MKNKIFFLSIIVPVYNETIRIDNLPKIFNYFKKFNFRFEVIIVNDGSTDNTLKKLKQLQSKFNFKILNYLPNRGKGYAVRRGMLQALGEFRLFTDVDLSTPIEEFELFIPYLKKHDIIIATRKKKGATLKIRQPKLRENLGKTYTWLSKKILNLDHSDFTCGFKVFSGTAAEKIFTQTTINRWGFDPEILYLATKQKLKIKEIPVIWNNNSSSKVKFPQDIVNSFRELIKIRVNDLRGVYKK